MFVSVTRQNAFLSKRSFFATYLLMASDYVCWVRDVQRRVQFSEILEAGVLFALSPMPREKVVITFATILIASWGE